MLDIELACRSKCYGFRLSKGTRERLFMVRRNTQSYVPSCIDIGVRKPIIKTFGGILKTMPVCVGIYLTKSGHGLARDNKNKDIKYGMESRSGMCGVFVNYYSKLMLSNDIYVPDNAYLYFLEAKIAIVTSIASGFNTVMFIGNDEPLVIDLFLSTKFISNAVDSVKESIEVYNETYRNRSNINMFKPIPGTHCAWCEGKNDCV